MNYILLVGLWLCSAVSLLAAPGVEMVFQPVALSGQLAPGLTNNIKFNSFEYVSLADDGRIAFTAIPQGPGVTSTNNRGLWAGLPGDLNLLVRTGDLVPGGTNGETFTALTKPNIDNDRAVGLLAKHSDEDPAIKEQRLWVNELLRKEADRVEDKLYEIRQKIVAELRIAFSHYNGYVINGVAGRAELFGPGIGPTNNQAIVAGPPTNVTIVAQTGFPAPGVSGNFTFFPDDSQMLALMPDGNVAFVAIAEGSSGFPGLWFGKASAVQVVAFKNHPAPASLLGPGYIFGLVAIIANVEVNAQGELAFATTLAGPGLNNTNSAFVVAGPPGGLRVIVQSGQPAPGIPGAVFADFSHVLLGTDGTVAFTARYTTNGTDYVSGLWLAPTNGAPPILLMHAGQRAPGTPAGVYFTRDFSVEAYFMNSRNQIVFRSRLSGPGFDHFDNGIWLAEPDGTVHLIVRKGDMVDTGSGVMARVSNVTFGADPEFIAGPEDGRRTPFNDRGEVALQIYFDAPPPPLTGSGGLFIAQTGLILRAERIGNDIHLRFPTLTNQNYRVDYATNLIAPIVWSALDSPVPGTGSPVIVTNTGAAAFAQRYYRVVRTD